MKIKLTLKRTCEWKTDVIIDAGSFDEARELVGEMPLELHEWVPDRAVTEIVGEDYASIEEAA